MRIDSRMVVRPSRHYSRTTLPERDWLVRKLHRLHGPRTRVDLLRAAPPALLHFGALGVRKRWVGVRRDVSPVLPALRVRKRI